MADEQDTIAGLRVLVVDDTATNRHLMQAFLKKLECEVFLAENGARAIEVFQQEQPDLILMDVMMPVMDGYEATRHIKAMSGERWVPIVFVSALDKEENLVAGLEAGGDDYLAKPVNFTVLRAKLRSLVRTLGLQRTLEETRRRTEAITDNIADCVITIDTRGNILSANSVVMIVFGYTPEEVIGRNVSMLMPEPHRSAHDGYISNYVRGGMPTIVGMPQRRLVGLHKDGTVIPVELTVTEMRFDGSRLFVGIVRDIREQLAAEHKLNEHAEALQRYHDMKEDEVQLAGGIMERLLLREGLSDPQVHHWLMPATDFSGDAIAAAHAPDGRRCIMLADATGHGLAAAISVLPALTFFYNLVEHAYPLGYVAYEINRQLLSFMPTGRFVAASLVCFDASKQQAELWLGGMPDLLLIEPDGTVHHHIASSHVPLGIVDFDEDMAGIARIDILPGSQLVLMSDGLIEAANATGEPFGTDRLMRALAAAPAAQRLEAVRTALNEHLGGIPPHDDVSILVLDC